MQHNEKLYISQFEAAYLKLTGSTCRVAHYGFPTLYALLKALPCTVILKELRHKRKILILLNRKLAGKLNKSYKMGFSNDILSKNDCSI